MQVFHGKECDFCGKSAFLCLDMWKIAAGVMESHT